MSEADLDRIDRSLLGMRHVWSGPLHVKHPDMGKVEMSTVWIVNALARSDPHGLSTRELATDLDVAHSTASRLVDRAVIRGVVTRGPSPDDARLALVTLTDPGRTLAATARRFRAAYLARVTATWTEHERATFADLLTRFAGAITSTPPTEVNES